jgi:hypothetical protein
MVKILQMRKGAGFYQHHVQPKDLKAHRVD